MAYYPISREELEAWMQEHGFGEEEPFKRERVFALYLSAEQRVVVYTTLLEGADAVRPTGGASGKRESMRVVAQYVGRDGGWYAAKTADEKAKRKKGSSLVKRTTGWAKSLDKAVAKRAALVEPRGPARDPEPRPEPPRDRPPPTGAEWVKAAAEGRELTGVTVSFPLEIQQRDGTIYPQPIVFNLPADPDQLGLLTDAEGVALGLAMVPLLKGWQEAPPGKDESIADILRGWERRLFDRGLSKGQRNFLETLLHRGLDKGWVLDRLQDLPEGTFPSPTEERPQAPAAPVSGCPDAVPPKNQLKGLSDEEALFIAECIEAVSPEGWDDPARLTYNNRGTLPGEFVASFKEWAGRGRALSEKQRWRLHTIINEFRDDYVPSGPPQVIEEGLEVEEAGGGEPLRDDPDLMAAIKEAKKRLGWSGAQVKDFAAGLGITNKPHQWTVRDGQMILRGMLEQLGDGGGGILDVPTEKVAVQTQKTAVEVTPEAAAWASGPLLTEFPATEEQAAFIGHPGGPALVDAIAGSGKTSTVMRRLLALWRSGQDMTRVLAITFTTAARADMTRKWNELAVAFGAPLWTAKSNKGPDIRTIHALGNKLIRTGGIKLQADVSEKKEEAPQVREGQQHTPKQVAAVKRSTQYALMPSILRGLLRKDKVYESEEQDDAIHAMDFYTATQPGAPPAPLDRVIIDEEMRQYGEGPGGAAGPVPVMQMQAKATATLKKEGRITFSGMLVQALALFDSTPAKAARMERLYDHVIVDEAQDVSPLQLAMAFRIAGVRPGTNPNLALVGDSLGQSIYSFQGGRPELIQSYAAEAAVYPLTVNFRSVGNIVYAAARLTDRDERPVPGKPDGPPIEVASFDSEVEAAAAAVQAFAQAHESGTPWRDMAMLYRVSRLSAFPQLFLWQQDIPHIVERGEIFWNSPAARVAVEYLRFVLNPSIRTFNRIVSKPYRGFGKGYPADARRVFEEVGPGAEVWQYLNPDLWAENNGYGVENLSNDIERVEASMGSASEAVRTIAEFAHVRTGALLKDPREDKGPDEAWTKGWDQTILCADIFNAPADQFVGMVDEAVEQARRIKLLKKLSPAKRDAEILKMFGEEGAVTLTTAHSSKGREWPHVLILGFQPGLFPLERSLKERGAEGEAEERRIAYVAVTRAKETLLLSTAIEAQDEETKDRGPDYLGAVLGEVTLPPPAVSPYLDQYTGWVLAGAPAGEAPFVIRPKSVE